MERKVIHYFNSYGCKTIFIVRREGALLTLKRRKFVYVLPEVVEIIDRLQRRASKEVMLEEVSLELNVHPIIIFSIFNYLKRVKLLGPGKNIKSLDFDGKQPLFDLNKKWAGTIYPILRAVEDGDYGPDVKAKKEGKEERSY